MFFVLFPLHIYVDMYVNKNINIKKNFNVVVFKKWCQDYGCNNNLAWYVGEHTRLLSARSFRYLSWFFREGKVFMFPSLLSMLDGSSVFISPLALSDRF